MITYKVIATLLIDIPLGLILLILVFSFANFLFITASTFKSIVLVIVVFAHTIFTY